MADTTTAKRERINLRLSHQALVLARRDARVFFSAIANPPAPNDRLTKALNEHTRRVDSR